MLKLQTRVLSALVTFKEKAADDRGEVASSMAFMGAMAAGAVVIVALVVAWARTKVTALP